MTAAFGILFVEKELNTIKKFKYRISLLTLIGYKQNKHAKLSRKNCLSVEKNRYKLHLATT